VNTISGEEVGTRKNLLRYKKVERGKVLRFMSIFSSGGGEQTVGSIKRRYPGNNKGTKETYSKGRARTKEAINTRERD